MVEKLTRMGIGLCAELGDSKEGLDLDAITGLLRSDPNVEVEVVPSLSRRPEQALGLAARTHAEGLVLGLPARPAESHQFQRSIRKAGLDPFAVELVALGSGPGNAEAYPSTDKAALMLRAAVDRLRAFAGSDPEQLKLRFLHAGGPLSRRSLISLPPWTYEAVPTIDPGSCLGKDRCGRCEPACPFGAVRTGADGLHIDPAGCETCGRCMAACPARAISWPGSSLSQYEAQVATLLTAPNPRLALGCRRALATLDGAGDGPAAPSSEWLPVEVPCMGMVTSGWVLEALAGGAEAVTLVGCGGDCRAGQRSVVEDRVAYVRDLLAALDVEQPEERVKLLFVDGSEPTGSSKAQEWAPAPVEEAPRPGSEVPDGDGGPSSHASIWLMDKQESGSGLNFAEPSATADAVLGLAGSEGAPKGLSLEHAASPLGLVRVREETCTSCGSCAAVCPTRALVFGQEESTSVLSFDATRCIACGRCVEACPEQAHDTLALRGATDLAALSAGRATLKREAVALCKSCGAPVAPDAMLGRVRTLLEGQSPSLLDFLGDHCIDCRGLAQLAAPDRDSVHQARKD